MLPLLIDSIQASNPVAKPSVVTGTRPLEQWEGVELVLLEVRGRILNALDRELEAVRATIKGCPTNGCSASPEVLHQSPLPANVLTLNREVFASTREPLPAEAALDPALERATIEELNAALAAAFSQVSES